MTAMTAARRTEDGPGATSGWWSDRFAWRWICGLLALYAVSFALFYPTVVTNTDETGYLNQAQLLLQGERTFTKVDALTGESLTEKPTNYTPGTGLLMAPLIALFGWRGSFVIPLVCLLVAILVTARWLSDEGRSPLFALLILGFAPTLVMGRLAMSDVPSAAVVALGLWLFWRGLDRGASWWLAAGFVAGLSILVRPTNPLPFVPLFAGTVLRRDRHFPALVVGGVAGVAVYLATMAWFFEDAFYGHDAYVPDLDTLHERVFLYALGLLVFVPGGLVLVFAYRGRRRPELILSLLGFVGFYLAQEYSTQGTAPLKRLILALRYLIPILPLVAFAMGESVPRLWRSLLERRDAAARAGLQRIARGAVQTALVGLAVGCALVHPVFASWAATQAEIRNEIHRHVPPDEVYITNWPATRKFLPELVTKYKHIDRNAIQPEAVAALVERYGQVYIVFLDRTDSERWRQDTQATAQFVDALGPAPRLLLDHEISSTERLRIWQIRRAVASSATP